MKSARKRAGYAEKRANACGLRRKACVSAHKRARCSEKRAKAGRLRRKALESGWRRTGCAENRTKVGGGGQVTRKARINDLGAMKSVRKRAGYALKRRTKRGSVQKRAFFTKNRAEIGQESVPKSAGEKLNYKLMSLT